ncbi:GNAT family N-acetyltransferase [Streptomyces sp. G3]|uniref:GNAT family N-acetyltransferase n=1 Tax=Streptomyces TaxID=1883 RepID=UPI000C9CED77|nr:MULTISPECIES: GNAT family N-acetyltransferase [Streptomyces]MCM1941940.1 GNAT family N-acetyltransferase [Streptomyces sp. G3]MCQ4199443.1 GNAT family N-acetyltransferase [Streptomyces coelicoflavus]
MAAEPLERALDHEKRLTRPTPPPTRLRPARESDLPELERLDEEAFQEVAYPAFLLRQFHDLYAGPAGHLLVLDDGDGRLSGYVMAATAAFHRDSWILGLCVAADRRRHGLGRKLMLEVLERLRHCGTERVRLTVGPANDAAILFYRSLGFRPEPPDGGLRRDYFGPGEDREVMCLVL